MANKYTAQDYAFQFITVTAGVLIALLIDGLVDWNHDRELVATARATMAREIEANKKELDGSVANAAATQKKFETALKFAADLLRDKKTDVNEMRLSLDLPDLSSAAWHTAERTGALALMDYDDVQRYSRLYDFQDLFLEEQRTLLSQFTAASSALTADFNIEQPNVKDLEAFRTSVTQLSGTYGVHQQMGKSLAQRYDEALKR